MRVIIHLCIFLSIHNASGVGYYPSAGAAALSLGGAGMMPADIFCAVNNPSRMPEVKNGGIGFSLCNRFALKDVNQLTLCGVLPYKKSAYGCKLSSHGNNVLSNLSLGVCFAHKIHPQFSFGVGANYHTYRIKGYGSHSWMTMEFSLTTTINEKLSSAFGVFNPLGSRPVKAPEEPVQRTARLGVQYKFNSKASLIAELEKHYSFRTNLKMGCHYQLNPAFYLDVGFSTLQPQCTFGFGFKQKHLFIGFASAITYAPGISHNLSIIYEIGR